MPRNKGQASLEMLIVLAAAISFLVVFLSAAGDFSNKALERSELQTQKTAFNDIVYNLNLVNSMSTGSAYQRKVTLVEKTQIQLHNEVATMTFNLLNKTANWTAQIPNQIDAQLDLKQGENTLVFQKETGKITINLAP